jgi:hypothetical protein
VTAVKRGEAVSGFLMDAVRQAYIRCLKDAKSGKVAIVNGNNYSHHAITAYVLSVCALEAFINELLVLAYPPLRIRREEIPLAIDELVQLRIQQRYLLVPHLLWNKTFQKGREPFSSFEQLINIRNDLVHYKLKLSEQGKGPSYFKFLGQKTVLLPPEHDWLSRICTTKGALWAHNTVCKMAQKLIELADDRTREFVGHALENFNIIPPDASVEDIKKRHVRGTKVRRTRIRLGGKGG